MRRVLVRLGFHHLKRAQLGWFRKEEEITAIVNEMLGEPEAAASSVIISHMQPVQPPPPPPPGPPAGTSLRSPTQSIVGRP